MFYKNYNISEKVKYIDNKGPHMGGKAGFICTLVLSLIFILLVRPMKWRGVTVNSNVNIIVYKTEKIYKLV